MLVAVEMNLEEVQLVVAGDDGGGVVVVDLLVET